jgi:hypothetical protein
MYGLGVQTKACVLTVLTFKPDVVTNLQLLYRMWARWLITLSSSRCYNVVNRVSAGRPHKSPAVKALMQHATCMLYDLEVLLAIWCVHAKAMCVSKMKPMGELV